MHRIRTPGFAGLVLLAVLASGCASPPATMQPLQPDEIRVLVKAATTAYLQQHPLSPGTTRELTDYLAMAQGMVQQAQPDWPAIQGVLVTHLPSQYQALGEAGLVILVNRVNVGELVQAGEVETAKRYVRAAVLGVQQAVAGQGGGT